MVETKSSLSVKTGQTAVIAPLCTSTMTMIAECPPTDVHAHALDSPYDKGLGYW